MNKKIIAFTLGIMIAMSGMTFAAPMTDLSAGKVAVDLSITKPETSITTIAKFDLAKKTNFDFGLTAGIGDKWGLQYKYQNADTKTTNITGMDGRLNSKVQEINLIYQLDKNFQVFTGVNKFSSDVIFGDSKVGSYNSENKYQLGVTGVTKLGGKLSGWATLAAGDDNYTYELGLAQELSKNLDLNLFYRYKKFDNAKISSGATLDSMVVSGFGLGVTAKF